MAARRRERERASEASAREHIIADIRLRQAPGAQLVVLEHTLRFNDQRKRLLVVQKLVENAFEVATAETHEEGTAFWLLAKRSVLVDHAPDEMNLVATFTHKSGGVYADCKQSV